jgi:hypothetical protein
MDWTRAQKILKIEIIDSVRPEMVDFGSWQGPSEFSTAGIAGYSED